MALWIKLSGLLAGVLARTILPYLRKIISGRIKGFSRKYWLTAIASLILSVITTLYIFPRFEPGEAAAGAEALIRLFCTAFAFGFSWNSLINEAGKWWEKPEGEKK